ncbi:hypothetical protein [Anaerobaca lacustris]|uniref:DNA-binding protein n=1 Tax=Anaerobaca lacustris TaxID=3044600 RepID=A0AAW6U4G3_9BACT|nr:hypothetical protein [Sedimentisphaerales bacterium M17dextr]
MAHSAEVTSPTAGMLGDGRGGYVPCPELLTEAELIQYLRIPLISGAADHGNVITNLKRMHGLPCIHISKQPLYPLEAIRLWVQEKIAKEQSW